MGCAFATLLSITLYSLAKLLFVVKRMHLYPFTKETVTSLIVTAVLFLAFYFWEFPLYPLIGIALKSIILTAVYLYVNYKLVISKEINDIIDKMLLKFKLRS